MDADAPRTRSSATAAMSGLRIHDPGPEPEPIAVKFPRLVPKNNLAEAPQQFAKVVLGTTRKSRDELDRIRTGDVILLDQPSDAPFALVWENEIIAQVELVKVEGVTVWKVVEMAATVTKEAADE